MYAQLDLRINTSTRAVIKTRKISPASCTNLSLKIMYKLKFQNCYDLWQRELDTYTNMNLNLSTAYNQTTASLETKMLRNAASSGLTSEPTFRQMAVLSSTETNGHSS